MKCKRKYLAMLAVLLLGILLVGCNKNVGAPEDNAEQTPEEIQAEETKEGEQQAAPVIGFSVSDMDNPYYVTLENAIREEVEKDGYKMITKNPVNDAEKQAQQIQELIEAKIDILFVAPVDWEKITPSLEALKDAGVKVINLDSQVRETKLTDAYIGSDNQAAGEAIGEDLIKNYPDGGKIAMLESRAQNSITERITGFEQKIATAEKGFEVISRRDTNATLAAGLEQTKAILAQNPEVDVIICGNDQLALGAAQAAKQTANCRTRVYGVDGSPAVKTEILANDSRILGTVAQSPIKIGKSAVQIAKAMLEDTKYEEENLESVFLITKENVDVYGADGWQ